MSYATLRKHYGVSPAGALDLARFAASDPTLFGIAEGVEGQSPQAIEKSDVSECEEGDLNPHGCYPTSPSN